MRTVWGLAIVIVVLSLVGHPLAEAPSADVQPSLELFEWQLLEGGTGRSVSFEDWITWLRDQDVIYLGEEHHNRFHIMAAVKVLEALLRQGQRPAIGLEMLSWDAQPVLNRYVAGELTTQDFLREVKWDQTWGGAYEDYAPLIDVGRQHHLPLVALNPPRPLVRRVVAVGLSQALNELQTAGLGLGLDMPDDPRYSEIITRQIELCHPGMSAQGYQRMYEASVFRDESMAKTIADYLRDRSPQDGPLLSYTGGGHIQYQLPIPKRVLRRQAGSKQVSVYLTSFELRRSDEIKGMLQEGIADYVWLTPQSVHGAPKRCG